MKITYLISPQSVKDVTNISDNLSEKYILTAIREAQQTELTTVLGVHFISTIEHLIENNEIGNPEHANIKFVLDNYISYFLIYDVIEKLIPLVSVKLDNAGAVMSENEDTENLSFSDMLKLQDYYRQKSDFYKNRLQKYLRNNRSMFGDLLCCSELDSAYSSPIFLGGKRGKHILRPCECTCGHISPENPENPDEPTDNTVIEIIRYRTYDGQPIAIESGLTDWSNNPLQIVDNNWNMDEEAYELRVEYKPDTENKGWILGETSFKGNANLMSVDLSDAKNLAMVKDRAFSESGAKEVVFNRKCSVLHEGYTFYNCGNLERVVLPYGLSQVGIAEFRGCKNLKEIVFSNGYDTNEAFTIYDNRLLVFLKTGAMLAGTSNYLNYPEIKHIGEEALIGVFTGENDEDTLYLPSTLESIGKWAMAFNDNIKRIVYGGTFEQFSAIVKGREWFSQNQLPVILECFDGKFRYYWETDEYEFIGDELYLTFTALEDGEFSLNKKGTGDIQYSKDDGATWTTLASGETVSVVTGDNVQWKGSVKPNYTHGVGIFASTAKFNASGNVMSLTHGDEFIGQTELTENNYFKGLFSGCTNLVEADRLSLPATTLKYQCYYEMFKDCTSLTKAPSILPALDLADSCYYSMFKSCSSLLKAPKLPAMTMIYSCYYNMFANCTSLTTAPELPATTLAQSCYAAMFGSCKSLTKAPELPATTLAGSCYSAMFANCTSLTTAPVLPAPVLVDSCYYRMFYSCEKLTYIKMLALDWLDGKGTNSWCSYISASGTFVKRPELKITRGTAYIPSNWNVFEETE